jgi:hypothetical protein
VDEAGHTTSGSRARLVLAPALALALARPLVNDCGDPETKDSTDLQNFGTHKGYPVIDHE